MRDILLIGVIAALLTLALRRPFVGVLAWAWFSVMTPHQIAYDVYGIPLNLVIAAVTLFAYVISGEAMKFRMDPVIASILALAGWLTVSQIFSLNPENSAPQTDRFLKTLLFVLLCAQMATTKLRLHALIWILVAGIGFFAVKGALFTVITLGEFRVQGLPDTIIEDNNHFGIATATILPLILYLRTQAKAAWLRHGLTACLVLCVLAVLGTHSRGGFIALALFGIVMWIRSRHKFALAAAAFAVLIPAIAFMPAKWTDRMTTITSAADDKSFIGRVDAWVINAKLGAAHPLTGAGLRNSYLYEVARTVDPVRGERARAAHSIYFEMLGGAGVVGLGIYLGLYAAGFFAAWNVFARRREPNMDPWKPELARAIQFSLIVFALGGASVSMEMWDGYLMLIACAGGLSHMTSASEKQPRFALDQRIKNHPSPVGRPRTAPAITRI